MASSLNQHLNNIQEELILCDQSFIAHPTGALIWPSQQTLIVADLYLRSGFIWSALNKMGKQKQASLQLRAIENLIATQPIKQVIALGRSFRRLDDPYHIDAQDLTLLYNMQKQTDWLWVAGAMARQYPNMVGGIRMIKYEQDGFTFQASPRKVPVSHEISAGMYPLARVEMTRVEPTSIETSHLEDETAQDKTYPCFVSNRQRLIMPAFGGLLAARNILGDEFLPFFGYDDLLVQVVDQYKTYPIHRGTLKAG